MHTKNDKVVAVWKPQSLAVKGGPWNSPTPGLRSRTEWLNYARGSSFKGQKCRLRLQRQLITTANLRRVRFHTGTCIPTPSGATQLHASSMSRRNALESFYIIVWTTRIKPELLDHSTTVSLRGAIYVKRSSLDSTQATNQPRTSALLATNMVFARWSTIFQSSSVRCKLKNAIEVGVQLGLGLGLGLVYGLGFSIFTRLRHDSQPQLIIII